MAFDQNPILSNTQDNLQNYKSVMWQISENICTKKMMISVNPHSFKKGSIVLRNSTQNWTTSTLNSSNYFQIP